jgi:hypothetical protein
LLLEAFLENSSAAPSKANHGREELLLLPTKPKGAREEGEK